LVKTHREPQASVTICKFGHRRNFNAFETIGSPSRIVTCHPPTGQPRIQIGEIERPFSAATRHKSIARGISPWTQPPSISSPNGVKESLGATRRPEGPWSIHVAPLELRGCLHYGFHGLTPMATACRPFRAFRTPSNMNSARLLSGCSRQQANCLGNAGFSSENEPTGCATNLRSRTRTSPLRRHQQRNVANWKFVPTCDCDQLRTGSFPTGVLR
jgi:hypothetical protein